MTLEWVPDFVRKKMATSFFDFLHVHKQKTFRPKKRFPHGTLRYNLHKHAQATLNSGVDLKQVVKLPASEVLEDWLAVNSEFNDKNV
uniref:DUF4351 domain-containing protein n=1 Tax=Globodera pallida TaxID=36090 RepID=A0A183BZW4_GLOPA